MSHVVRWAYTGGMTLANALARVAPASESKLWRSIRARRDLVARWERQAASVRDTSRPLVWMHAPSVGEGLQARPVAQALRAARPDVQIAYSFYSPSAERFAESIGADLTGYLPFDTARAADRLLDALAPSALVFVKLDVWPVLVARAKARGIPVLLLSATLAEGSGRRGGLARTLLHEAYAALDLVGAIDAVHAHRLAALGVPEEALSVSGDTRFDQVWARASAMNRPAIVDHLRSIRPTLVAGSTWPADESVLLPAWRAIRARVPHARLIIAPHEPTEAHVEPISAWARSAGLRSVRLSAVEAAGDHTDDGTSADVIIVDRTGILGDLYAIADAAFVGGGFHAAGLHSVIEPAAYGVPVVFGPGHSMSREAGLLIVGEGGVSVHDTDALSRVAGAWLADPAARQITGAAARDLVRSERGATDKALALVLHAVDDRRAPQRS